MSQPAHMTESAGAPQLLDTIWEKQQIKAFTAWINSHLRTRDLKIENIQTDLSDGVNMIALMEIVGDVKLGKAAKGKMRIHKIQNLNVSLNYIKEKGVKLIGIGAEEICDENLKLILGTVWTIILRFDIQDISEDEMSAKDALLLWCQRKTKGYENVNITNFTKSWQNGLGFCALIHKHRPDLLDFNALNKSDSLGNLTLALKVADEQLGIMQMLDPEDVVNCIKPDERSIMTQVAAFYKCFAGYNKNEVAASKIANVLAMNQEHEKMIQEYELMASELLRWVPSAVAKLEERPDLLSVDASVGYLSSFAPFRSEEYPGKLQEKAVLEAHYSSLQTKLRLSGRAAYEPTEGKLISDVQTVWGTVDAADVENKKWVVAELHRNKLCLQKAAIFEAKARSHEAWGAGVVLMLSEDDYSMANLGALSQMLKKHDAFKAELEAKQPGVGEIGHLANELDDLRYGDSAATNQRYANIYSGWEEIMQLAESREANILAATETQKQLDELFLTLARDGAPLNSDLDEFIDALTQGIFAESLGEVEDLKAALSELQSVGLVQFEQQYNTYMTNCDQCEALQPAQTEGSGRKGSVSAAGENPYAVHTREEIAGKFAQVQSLLPQRAANLAAEEATQVARNDLKIQWATEGNAGKSAIDALHTKVKDISSNQSASPEDSKASLAAVQAECDTFDMASLEALSAKLEGELIFENEHSPLTVEQVRGAHQSLSVQISAADATFTNQILTRDATNISDEQMDEFKASFNHFDKDKSGNLDRMEFRGCLLSLGVDIPAVPTGEDSTFKAIWAQVDPNGDNTATFAEFVAYMSSERADASSKDDLLEQFKTLSGGQPYIVAAQLSELNPELVQYCLDNMAPFEGGPPGALDYASFAAAAFGEDTAV